MPETIEQIADRATDEGRDLLTELAQQEENARQDKQAAEQATAEGRDLLSEFQESDAPTEGVQQPPVSRREFAKRMGLDPSKPLPPQYRTAEARENTLRAQQSAHSSWLDALAPAPTTDDKAVSQGPFGEFYNDPEYHAAKLERHRAMRAEQETEAVAAMNTLPVWVRDGIMQAPTPEARMEFLHDVDKKYGQLIGTSPGKNKDEFTHRKEQVRDVARKLYRAWLTGNQTPLLENAITSAVERGQAVDERHTRERTFLGALVKQPAKRFIGAMEMIGAGMEGAKKLKDVGVGAEGEHAPTEEIATRGAYGLTDFVFGVNPDDLSTFISGKEPENPVVPTGPGEQILGKDAPGYQKFLVDIATAIVARRVMKGPSAKATARKAIKKDIDKYAKQLVKNPDFNPVDANGTALGGMAKMREARRIIQVNVKGAETIADILERQGIKPTVKNIRQYAKTNPEMAGQLWKGAKSDIRKLYPAQEAAIAADKGVTTIARGLRLDRAAMTGGQLPAKKELMDALRNFSHGGKSVIDVGKDVARDSGMVKMLAQYIAAKGVSELPNVVQAIINTDVVQKAIVELGPIPATPQEMAAREAAQASEKPVGESAEAPLSEVAEEEEAQENPDLASTAATEEQVAAEEGAAEVAPEQTAPDVGTEWQSKDGAKKIIGKTAEGAFVVETPTSRESGIGHEIVPAKDIAGDIAFDEKSAAAASKVRDKNTAIAEKDAAEEAARIDIDGFGDELTPAQRGLLVKRLNKTLSFNGAIKSRKQGIRDAVATGAVVKTVNGERRLTNPDGSFLSEKDISKTAMDYAEHLASVQAPVAKPVAAKPAAPPKQVAPSKPGVPGDANASWRLTRKDFRDQVLDRSAFELVNMPEWLARHKQGVEQAVAEGKPVPPEVLADYPDLAKPKPRVPGGDAMAAIGGDSFETEAGPETAVTEPKTSEKAKKLAGRLTNNQFADGILEIVAPATRGESARKASHIMRENLAAAAQRDEAVKWKLHEFSKQFRMMPPEQTVDFIDRMETGQKQPTMELQEVADTLRAVLDKSREMIQTFGKLSTFYEDYFPHLFNHPDSARDTIMNLLGTRTLKPASFLKQRKYLTVKEALDAGLELAHYNPVQMVLARIHEMNKYAAGSTIMQDFKESGLAVFTAESLDKSYLPAGYEFVDDPAFRVVANPEITVQEAYDKLLTDQLLGVATNLGITHKRLAKMRGKKWGESGPGGTIKTRFAGPVSVIAHEIGHQIGDAFGLYDYMLTGKHLVGRVYKSGAKKGQPVKVDVNKNRATIRKEMRALADLRLPEEGTSEGFGKYVRKKAEKEAVMLEAWLAAPEKMAEVAPTVTAAWKEFLGAHVNLRPLLNLDRSVVLGSSSTTHELKGVLTLGRWALPKEAASVLNSLLKPGLRGNKNPFVRGTYEGIRFLGNAMNQASLSLSGFHAINVSTDAIASRIGLGIQKLARGDVKGLADLVAAPGAPVTSLLTGGKLLKAMRTDLADISDPRLKMMVETVIRAGGRASMDTMYHNHAVEGLVRTLRDLRFGGMGKKLAGAGKLPFNLLFSALELAAKPIMQWQVPRLKLGVFYKLAEDVFAQAERKRWSDERIQTELGRSWDSVDNRMGQLSYDNLHWPRWFKDSAMAAVRSVGWNLGSFREFGGAGGDVLMAPKRIAEGDDIITGRMGYAIGAVTTYFMVGSAVGYLLTGNWPWEDEDDDDDEKAEGGKGDGDGGGKENDDDSGVMFNAFFPRTGNTNPDGTAERLTMPFYAKDWYAYGTQPLKTVKHKLHPLWGTTADILTNKDYYGTKIRNEDDPMMQQMLDVTAHIGEAFVPFSVKNYFRMRDAGESKIQAALIGASGIGSAPRYLTQTRAQKLMRHITAERMPKGSRTKEQADASKHRRDIIRSLRSSKKVDLSGLTSAQVRSIQRDAKISSFQVAFNRLSFNNALNVFNVANTKERKQAFELLLKKKANAKNVSDDALNLFYELKLTQGQLDARIKHDQVAIGKELMRLTVKRRKGESEDVYRLKMEEVLERLRKNPEYDLDEARSLWRARWSRPKSQGGLGYKVRSKAYWTHLRRLNKWLD